MDTTASLFLGVVAIIGGLAIIVTKQIGFEGQVSNLSKPASIILGIFALLVGATFLCVGIAG